LVQAKETLDEILDSEAVTSKDFIALRNLQERLAAYLRDEKVQEALDEFEEAYGYLQRLRKVLRLLIPKDSSTPRSEPHTLRACEAEELRSAIEALKTELREELSEASTNGQRCIRILIDHLERHGAELEPMILDSDEQQQPLERTTAAIEQFFRGLKRLCRRIHGRSSVRLELMNLPAELPLVFNLQNETYLKLTVGSLEALPRAFSEHWKRAKEVLAERVGKPEGGQASLPKAVLRGDEFLDDLTEVVALAAVSK